jgi:ribonuclease HII
LILNDFDWQMIVGVNDSKKLPESKREVIFERTKVLQREGKLSYVVEMVSAQKIDEEGISVCIKKAISKGLKKILRKKQLSNVVKSRRRDPGIIPGEDISTISNSRTDHILEAGEVFVKLDGSLRAPSEYLYQETIIKGDAKEKVIGLASIMAKVTRDRYMSKLAKQPEFAKYDFARHKGYGTKIHRAAIEKNGLSTEHRRSYCGNIKVIV